MTGNWFKVSRAVFSHPIADDKPWCKAFAWLYLVSMAAHDDYTVVLRQHEYPLKRGRLAISLSDFAEMAGWTRAKVWRFLRWLRLHEMIQLYSDHASTFVKIVNYDKWQGDTATATDTDTANGIADTSTGQSVEDESDTANGTATATTIGTPSEESTPLASPLIEGRQEKSTKNPPTSQKVKMFRIPHLTFNRETLTVDGFDDKARAYATTLFPNKDLDKAFHALVEWIVKTDRRYLNYWKSYITFCSGMPDEVVTRFNSGALKGQAYKVNHGASQVQENKRPLPVCDLKKLGIKGSE